MTDDFGSSWEKFEHSGRVGDYLEYRGITYRAHSAVKGEAFNDNAKGTDNLLAKCK